MVQRPLFVSSTFHDMQRERDILSRLVLPALRQEAETADAPLVEIDLRWGVTQTMAQDGGAVRICLDQVERCAPRIIGMIGERVGWVPEERFLAAAAPDFQHWLPGDFGLTGMEMAFAASFAQGGGPRMPVFLRDPALSDELGFEPDAPERMVELRAWVEGCPALNPIHYATLEEFTEAARAEIGALLRATRNMTDPGEPALEASIDRAHTRAALTRACKRHGRAVLTGAEGAGLSWIARQWATEVAGANAFHDGRRHAAEEIFARIDLPAERPKPGLIARFLRWIGSTVRRPQAGRIVIDHFDSGFRTSTHASLAALDPPPPSQMLVVVTRSPRLISEAQAAGWPVVEAGPPPPEACAAFGRAHLARFGKTLTSEQTDRLLGAPWLSNLHILRLVLDELRRHGRMEDLTARLDALVQCHTPQSVIGEITDGLGAALPDPWSEPLPVFMAALALSLRGLDENACRRLYAACAEMGTTDALPPHLWSAMRTSFGAALNDRAGRVDIGGVAMLSYVQASAESDPVLRGRAESAFASWLGEASPRQRAEEAPRLAYSRGGAEGLARILARLDVAEDVLSVGETFLEGWMEELPEELRNRVADAWADRATDLRSTTALALGLLAHRTGATAAGATLVSQAARIDGQSSVAGAAKAWLERDLPVLGALARGLDSDAPGTTPDASAKAVIALSALAEGLAVLELEEEKRILDRAKEWAEHASPDLKAQFLYLSGQIAIGHADWPTAAARFETAEQIARQTGNGHALAEALERRAAVALASNQFTRARASAENARRIALRIGLKRIEALALEHRIEVARRTARDEDFFRWTKIYLDRAAQGIGSRERAQQAFDSWNSGT